MEQFKIFIKEAVQSVSLALLAVAVVTLVMLSSPLGSFYVLLMVAMVDFELLALMYFWDTPINAVSITNIVMAIGLAVDYSSHITHAFMISPGKNKDKRVISAMGEIGASVFHGAFSTLLPIFCLGLSQSYIFNVFFRMWLGIIIFGSANGLILLPVILSLIGPASTTKQEYEQPRKEGETSAKEVELSGVASPSSSIDSKAVAPLQEEKI
mmetsp:Transcript_40546/g.46514  ORF Transcript_40546/g.46514 Transcript_40546/m.46514 type:complete len:211 (+) Transcript_40546:1132-1764(+)